MGYHPSHCNSVCINTLVTMVCKLTCKIHSNDADQLHCYKSTVVRQESESTIIQLIYYVTQQKTWNLAF